MRYNIINVSLDKKETFTSLYRFRDADEKLISSGYKQLTILKRKNCVNAYYYKESEE